MVYVDLNPVRAGMADTPEASDHTSIKERIKPVFDLNKAVRAELKEENTQDFDIDEKPLAAFLGHESKVETTATTVLPCTFADYLQLLDMTGRIIKQGKRGVIESNQPPILKRLSIPATKWVSYSTQFEQLHRCGEFR